MALTKIGTDGVKDDAVTSGKIPANAVGSSELADQSVSLDKLPHGTSSNNGKFLRANNGADPSFETVSIPAGTTINNNADNRVITGSGTANTLNGESSVVIDANGKLGVGTTSPSHKLHINDSSSNPLLMVERGSGATSFIEAQTDKGAFGTGNNHPVYFIQNSGSAMVIDTSKRVGIGTTAPLKTLTTKASSNTHALYIAANDNDNNGWGFQSDSSSGHLRLDRSIGNNFNYRRICFHGDGGIAFQGDTAAANALDDYEIGSWTPTIAGTSGAGTATYNIQAGRYVKIGKLVYLTCEVNWQSGNAGGELRITSLPFQPTTDCEGIGNAMFHNISIGGDTANISPYVGPSTSYMYFYQSRQGHQGWSTLSYDDNGAIIMNVSFRVA